MRYQSGLLTAGLVLLFTVPLPAQNQPSRQGPPQTPRRQAGIAAPAMRNRLEGNGPEAILRMKDQLKLTEAQLSNLETLRQEGVTRRREALGRTLDERSRIAAGLLSREDQVTALRERAEASRAAESAFAERVRGVLSSEQRVRLAELEVDRLRQGLRRQGQPGAGRRGGGGFRGGRPGDPGWGFAPGARPAARGRFSPGGVGRGRPDGGVAPTPGARFRREARPAPAPGSGGDRSDR